jgi:hypothetical protein
MGARRDTEKALDDMAEVALRRADATGHPVVAIRPSLDRWPLVI